MAFLLRLLLRSQSHDYICSSGGGGGAVFHTLDMALCDRALHPFDQPTLRITTLSTPTWLPSSCTGKGSRNQLPPFLITLRRAKNKLALSRLQTLCSNTKKKTKKTDECNRNSKKSKQHSKQRISTIPNILQSKKTHKADDQTNTTNLVISLPCSLARSLALTLSAAAPKLQSSSAPKLELKNSHQRRKQVIPFSSSPFPLIVVHT
jgi:hypothetical protein